MANSTSFLVFHLAILISLYATTSAKSNNVNVSVIADKTEFYGLYPKTHIEELKLVEIEGSRRYYDLGARTAGDTLVATASQRNKFPSMHNIGIKFNYPDSLPAKVNYVTIRVDQTSNFGRAYVVHGGLYQRAITIVVELYNTLSFSYKAQFYGIN